MGFSQSFQSGRPAPVLLAVIFALGIGLSLVMTAFACWIDAGFGRAIEATLRSGQDRTALVFSGAGRLFTLFLARVLCGLIGIACALVAMLPMLILMMVFMVLMQTDLPAALKIGAGIGIGLLWFVANVYVMLGLCLVTAIVSYENCGPTEAIARSWRLARGNRRQLLIFFGFQILIGLVGMLACGIGSFFAYSLAEVMRFEAYLALTQGREYPNWWIATGRFPFDEHKPEDFGSAPPPVPPPLPPQT